MCARGTGAGAMGVGAQAVEAGPPRAFDCHPVPPVSFFSPGWVHCISGLEGGRQRLSAERVSRYAHTLTPLCPSRNKTTKDRQGSVSHFLAEDPPKCRSAGDSRKSGAEGQS